jgi:hemerythrin superfamily protein
MDAVSLLKSDHAEVKSMFREFERGGADKHGLYVKIRDALKLHTMIEEEIFYPACEAKMRDLISEARQEHKTVDVLLVELGKIQAEDVRFDEMMREVITNVEHHAGEEETEMFPRAQEMLGMDELNRLGEQMQQRKGGRGGQRTAA